MRHDGNRGIIGGLTWQAEDEPRRAAGYVVEANLTAELTREPPGDGQAQAAAAAGFSAGIERIEHVLALVGQRTGAAVLDDQLDARE